MGMAQSNDMTKIKRIWSKLRDKAYRDSYVAHSIGNRIAAQLYSMRSKRGWTQADLAEKASMLQPRISVLERSSANVSLKTLKRIASAFDVALVVKFIPFSQLARETATETIDVAVPGFETDAIRSTTTIPMEFHSQGGTIHDTPLIPTGYAGRTISFMTASNELRAPTMGTSHYHRERLDA